MSVLRDLPIFKSLSATEFEKVRSKCKEVEIFNPHVLFKEGDSSDAVYIIKRGSVRIVKNENGQEIELSTLYNGEFFGEMGVLNNSPRSASAVIDKEAVLWVISATDFVLIAAATPYISKMVMSTMVGRFKANKNIAAPAAAPSAARPASASARLIGIFSGSGGVGISLVAANIAAAIKRDTGKRVLVFDLDLMFGDQAEVFGLQEGPSLSDIVEEEEIDFDTLRRCILATESGVDVIRAPSKPEHAELVMPGFIMSCLELLKPEYDYIICDTAHLVQEASIALLERLDEPIYLMTAEVICVKNASRWFSIMDRLNLPVDEVDILFNKYEPSIDEETADFVTEKFGKKVIGRLPMDGRTAKASLNTGKLIVLNDGVTELAQELNKVAAGLAGIEVSDKETGSFWSRWIKV